MADEKQYKVVDMSFDEVKRLAESILETRPLFSQRNLANGYLRMYAELTSTRAALGDAQDEIKSLNFNLEQKSMEVGQAEHRGNTVDYIYDKCINYGNQLNDTVIERDRLIAELAAANERIAIMESRASQFESTIQERDRAKERVKVMAKGLQLIRDFNPMTTPMRLACLTPEENMRIIAREALANSDGGKGEL